MFEKVNAELTEARERYNELMTRPADIEDILQTGAAKARATASPLLEQVREAVGIHGLA